MPEDLETRIARAWRDIYNTPSGREAIAGLLMDLNLYSEVAPNSVFEAGVLCGERNVAARIARYIGRAPADYVADATDDADVIDRILSSRTGDII